LGDVSGSAEIFKGHITQAMPILCTFLGPLCRHYSCASVAIFHVGSIKFLPCDAMRCTVFVIVILSVCLSVHPSVRPSVTLVDCVHMVQHTIMIYSPYDRPIILVSGDIKLIQKIRRGSPRARALNGGGLVTNWRFSTN